MEASVLKLNMSGVARKVGSIKTNRELGLYASGEAARLMDKYVPYKQGDLADSADTTEPWVVSYKMPYARRMYYGDGFNFTEDKHPAARSRWDKGIRKGHLAKLITKKAEAM